MAKYRFFPKEIVSIGENGEVVVADANGETKRARIGLGKGNVLKLVPVGGQETGVDQDGTAAGIPSAAALGIDQA